VSRAIATLEQDLDCQLLRRTTRQTKLTAVGEEFYKNISPLLLRLNEEIEEVSHSSSELSGNIKITAPEDMAQTILAEMISKYVDKFPNMEVKSVITNDFLDLTKEDIDLALRVGKLEDSSLIQRKLAEVGLILVASQKYLDKYGHPNTFKELKNHQFLTFRNFSLDAFNNGSIEGFKTIATSDSFSMLLNLTLNNDGISILPDYYCKKFLDDGSLIQVLPQWSGKKSSIHLVYAPTKKLPLKVREFINIAKKVSI
jgi:DNA-binding transcriptional LysR family regulator